MSKHQEGLNIVLLPDIIAIISDYISNTDMFKNIQAEVEVTEIKEYPNIVFMTVCDVFRSVNMKCVIFKTDYQNKIIVGNKIVISATVRLYKNEIQLVIKSYVLLGLGSNISALSKLKEDLGKKGYFDNKQEISQNYQIIGVISSLKAAGLKDFIHTIETRCSNKKLYLYPATVQGSAAPDEIVKQIKLANTHNMVKVIAIIRGGGSKEDLECFNDKAIARAIHESVIPIVTGIGHQIDVSVADMVADQNFITPTAVAQGITTNNLLTTDKINAEILFISDLFMIKFRSCEEYIIDSEEKILKCKNKSMEKISLGIQSMTEFGTNIRNRLETYLNSFYDKIVNSQADIKASVTARNHTMNSVIEEYAHLNQIIALGLDVKISAYDTEINQLGRPSIVDRKTKKEITLVKNLKSGQRYRINFIDGHHDIKISI